VRHEHLYARVYDLVTNESRQRQHPTLPPWTMPPLVIRHVQERK
jgi:hypothetical protein